jgi:hypothetical protein
MKNTNVQNATRGSKNVRFKKEKECMVRDAMD